MEYELIFCLGIEIVIKRELPLGISKGNPLGDKMKVVDVAEVITSLSKEFDLNLYDKTENEQEVRFTMKQSLLTEHLSDFVEEMCTDYPLQRDFPGFIYTQTVVKSVKKKVIL